MTTSPTATVRSTGTAARPLRLHGPACRTDGPFLMFELDEAAALAERRDHDVIRLTLGKCELPPPEPVVAAMLAAAADHATASRVHPAGLPELRDRLSAEYRHRYAVAIPARRFVISTGTSTLIRNLMQLLGAAGDEVVVPLPYYPLYPFTARLAGQEVRHYQIDPVTRRIDLDSLAAAITERTSAVLVNAPGNPLGNLLSPADLREVDRVVAGRAVLICDEIYADIAFDGPSWSAVSLMADLRSPLVVTSGFSKGYRMYARRVGYGIVPDELVGPLTVIQHHTLLTADPVPQVGAIAALDHAEAVVELTDRYRQRRDYTVRRFADVPGVRAIPAGGGFYLTLDCAGHLARNPGLDDRTLAHDILARTHVATVPGSDFGLPRALRLSYTAARYEEAIDRLAGYFTEAAAGPGE